MAIVDPEKEKARLTQFYSAITEDELLKVAEDWNSLTDVARQALKAEMASRGLTFIEPSPPEVADGNPTPWLLNLLRKIGEYCRREPDYVAMPVNPAIYFLRGCFLFFGHLLTAIIGTAIIVSPTTGLLRIFTHSTAATIVREWICSIIFSALLGAAVERRWRTRTAAWIWAVPLAGFLWEFYRMPGFPAENRWRVFSGLACAEERGLSCMMFWLFTVCLVRSVCYSIAAFFAARYRGPRHAEEHSLYSRILGTFFLIGLPKAIPEGAVEREENPKPGAE